MEAIKTPIVKFQDLGPEDRADALEMVREISQNLITHKKAIVGSLGREALEEYVIRCFDSGVFRMVEIVDDNMKETGNAILMVYDHLNQRYVPYVPHA